nr:PREDICTED: uncharacterized protein LOC109030589 [Bemisia tabaci]
MKELSDLLRNFIVLEVGKRNDLVVSKLPLTTHENLVAFEADLDGATFRLDAVNWLSLKIKQTLSESVLNILKGMFTDELVFRYSMQGFKRKTRLDLYKNILDVIKLAVRSKYPTVTDDDIFKPLKSWFAHAKQRLKDSGRCVSGPQDDTEEDCDTQDNIENVQDNIENVQDNIENVQDNIENVQDNIENLQDYFVTPVMDNTERNDGNNVNPNRNNLQNSQDLLSYDLDYSLINDLDDDSETYFPGFAN